MPLNLSGAVLTADLGSSLTYPITLFGWVRLTLSGNRVFTLGASGVNGNAVALLTAEANASAFFGNKTSWGSGGYAFPNGASTFFGSSLVPVMVIAASNTDFAILTSNDSGAGNPSNPNTGELNGQYFSIGSTSGSYAEVAVWNSALTYGNWVSLAGGAAPETISPGTLVDCWDLNPSGSAGSAAPSSFVGRLNARTLAQSGGTATVSSYTHPVTRASSPTLTGTSILDNMAPTGSMSMEPPRSLSGSVLLDEMLASGTLGLQPGTITSQPFKNWSGTVQAGVTIPKVAFVRISNMVTDLVLSNQVTNGAGVLSITSGSLSPGVSYLLVTCDAAGTAFGAEPYTAI
jgi:hypothetical protein